MQVGLGRVLEVVLRFLLHLAGGKEVGVLQEGTLQVEGRVLEFLQVVQVEVLGAAVVGGSLGLVPYCELKLVVAILLDRVLRVYSWLPYFWW